MLMLGVNPKWITHFPNGRHILDDGVTTDDEWWATQDAEVEESVPDACLSPEELLDLRLRELGF